MSKKDNNYKENENLKDNLLDIEPHSEKNEKKDKDSKANKDKKDQKNKKNKKSIKEIILSVQLVLVIIFFIFSFWFIFFAGKDFKESIFKKDEPYTYSQFITDLEKDKIRKITMNERSPKVTVSLKTEEYLKREADIIKKNEKSKENLKKEFAKLNEDIKKEREKKYDSLSFMDKFKENDRLSKYIKSVQVPTLDTFSELVQSNITKGKNLEFQIKETPVFTKFMSTLFSLIPTLLLVGLILFMSKDLFNSNNNVYEGESEESQVRFDDIAGLSEEKDQLIEVVDFLKNPERYSKMGARIPKGILLYGQPGTGKTLIAKAIAGEAEVPFISMSGSEFIEMFAGLGAKRVRKLFEKARKLSPAIIFVDEIDAIGSRRGGATDSSENNQTLNQMLVEMDGFNTDQNVIVLAATNRPEMLDKALLRPGRFDRQIVIPAPDVKGREEILRLHANNKNLAEDVDLKEIASNTAGSTGAELANVLNEAAILATNEGSEEISMENIEEALRKVTIGLEKQNKIISDKEKNITAYHESGHAIVSHMLKTQEDVKEVTIIPRGMAGGYTMYKQKEDQAYLSKRQLEESMIGLMGGRAAEDIILKDITTGASNDIEKATKIARNMITHYGMSNNLGPISLAVDDPYELNLYGLDVTKEIGKEVKARVEKAFFDAKDILNHNIDRLHLLAQTLLEKEKINEEEFREVMEMDLNNEEVQAIIQKAKAKKHY